MELLEIADRNFRSDILITFWQWMRREYPEVEIDSESGIVDGDRNKRFYLKEYNDRCRDDVIRWLVWVGELNNGENDCISVAPAGYADEEDDSI